ncbi:unnamed protein product [Staurois parvus]|uniref:Uncharacterized protein n=1 Tax=Staurois parvus TaxID=386267 RepID=A0ABN9HII6_9NEOB|nr:unnamed protein product [Staurois parvus]
MSAWSCDQLCPITADHMALMISVAPEVAPVSASSQCHINATYQCPSELPFNITHQCQSVPPINAIYQCHASVLPFSAHQ